MPFFYLASLLSPTLKAWLYDLQYGALLLALWGGLALERPRPRWPRWLLSPLLALLLLAVGWVLLTLLLALLMTLVPSDALPLRN